MTPIFPGRYTAKIEGSFVVFLIGMRVNRISAVSKWWPVVQAMGSMLKVLSAHPEKGFLAGESFFRGWPMTTLLLSYWRSFEALETFARNPADPHRQAWIAFQKAVGSDGSVGIWHETYLIEPNHYEAIYGNMPVFGLAAAAEHQIIQKSTDTAQQRLHPSIKE